ncbi:MAG TPA: MBL fold metallo-hydrolase [Candidatus Sulfotelmatobacter sp.]|nr:MBL fold metallo-hydrolase [Candidatus Sulfotelmatobacter sp.]
MRITFVNHAGFFLEASGTNLWCDPWTISKVYNNCASLYSRSAQVPTERVEYIWVSHEHSDHLNFPSLKSIPEEHRRRITFLHQKHSSPRVIDAARKLGFAKIVELPQYRWVTLRPGFDIFCGSVGTMDSFFVVKADGETILNMNDCICTDSEIHYIKRIAGKPSILLTQFSIAEWIGNHADDIGAVAQKTREFKYYIMAFQPEFTVPFASFSYWCNQENSWMNNFMISPAKVAAMNLPGVNFMYPGDVWDSSVRTFRSEQAVARYMKDIENLSIDPTPAPVEAEVIRKAAENLLQSMRKRFGKILMARIGQLDIYTHDTKQLFTVHPAQCRCEVRTATPEEAESARYVMCSQVAWYTFAHTWGWSVAEGTGTFIDRRFKEKGENELWRRLVTELSTDILRFNNPGRVLRTLQFLWGKKFEIYYHLFGKTISDEALAKLSAEPRSRWHGGSPAQA